MSRTLVPVFCLACPSWYELPDMEDLPENLWWWGHQRPPKNLNHGDLARATLMDEGHDYRLTATHFRFAYSGGDKTWVIIQYPNIDEDLIACPHCGYTIPGPTTGSRFCPMCGGSLT